MKAEIHWLERQMVSRIRDHRESVKLVLLVEKTKKEKGQVGGGGCRRDKFDLNPEGTEWQCEPGSQPP